MAYCPECGEKVAEIDVFCPFCGISLQAVKSANEGDSLDSTIVISASETNLPIPSSLPEQTLPAEETTSIAVEENESSEEIGMNDETFLKQDTAENWILNTKSVDVPADLFNKDVSEPIASETPIIEQQGEVNVTEENVIEPKTSFDEKEIPEPLIEDLDATEENINLGEAEYDFTEENIKPSELEIDASTDEEATFDETDYENSENPNAQTESSLASYEEAEIKEIPSAEAPETTSGENVSQPDEPEFVMTIPYVAPSSKLDQTADETESESIEAIEETSSTDAEISEEHTDEVTNFDEVTANDTEDAIEKPLEELPEIDYPPSRFDSVSIIEKTEPKAEASDVSAKSQEEQLVENLDLKQPAEKDGRSHTSPNIGINDTDGKKRAKLQPLDEGAILNGRYEIVRKIGGGGMGAVYLASDKNLGGVLRAVKEMVQSYIEETQQDKAVSDFKRESMLLTSLEHQSIPTIYDYFFDEKEARFYLVMKYISGGDLSARIRSANQGRIDEKDVTEWAIQIADVLDYLHNRQPPIVYRDLKPANIMIDGNSGRVMLIDFGIARWINKEEKGVTAVGTMGYAPPELFSGNVEARSDIYSLGSTMFHLLTGADPQSNPLLIFDFQKHPRPRQINPQLSDQMEKILMKSVEYNAENRFSSAASMRQALEEHLANLKANKVTFGVKQTTSSVALSDEPVFCGFCGQKIVATDMFCAFCGAKQPLARHGEHSENFASPPPTARLMIIGTNELETPAYKIEKDENLVGRRDPMSNIFPEVDLSKYDPQTKISRRHARIWREGNQFLVEDLGSSNGTVVLPIVNETVRLLPHQPYTLTNGDKLRLGDTTLHFIIG